jgi:ferredoxin
VVWYDVLGWVIAVAVAAFTASFIVAAWREGERRALLLGLGLLGGGTLAWVGLLVGLQSSRGPVLVAGQALFLVGTALLMLPIGRKEPLRIVGPLDRVDERDIIFARMRYQPDSPEYEDYYARHPERKELDDRLQSLPQLCSPGTGTYHPLNSPIADACFEFLGDIGFAVDGPVNPQQVEVDPAAMSRRLKGMAHYFGAVLAGITELKPHHVYTHVGRGPGGYGTPIVLNHRYALAFAVEMDYFMVRQAPRVTTVTETAAQYVEAAKIAILLAYYIRSLGYPARAHIDANYQVICPAVAADAGLGEIGRIGILMSQEYGPRMRLGVVTTDIPLVPDEPVTLGIQDFCQRCKKCATNCPARAIPMGQKTVVRGVEKWVLDSDRCYEFWRRVGTDCAICMSVCPYSHPRAFVHNVTRFAIERSVVARQVAVWADDLFYGRRPRSNDQPDWMC